MSASDKAIQVRLAGTLSNGQIFRDIRDWKKILLKQRKQVAFNLTKNLLAYGTGREMGFADRAAIEKILKRLLQIMSFG